MVVDIRYDTFIDNVDHLETVVVVGADELNSLVRRTFEDQFRPKVEYFDNHFA